MLATLTLLCAAELTLGTQYQRDLEPYTPQGAQRFIAVVPDIAARIGTENWSLDVSNRSASGRVHYAHVGSVHLGFIVYYTDIRSRHDVFETDNIAVATKRHAQGGWAGLDFSSDLGRATSVRLTTAAGYYRSRYWSLLSSNGQTGFAPIEIDKFTLAHGQLEIRTAGFANGRVRLAGSLRCLRTIGIHSPLIPDIEWLGGLGAEVLVSGTVHRGMFLGTTAQLASSKTPALLLGSSLGIHGTWTFR
jgi:hypothetical protein